MYKNEFDKELKQNQSYNAYLFHGEDDYLIQSYSLKVANLLGKKEEITKLYFDEYKMESAKEILLQNSLFSDHNILFIKVAKKIPKKELTILIQCCETNPMSKLIISCVGDEDFRTMESSFTKKNNSVFVRFYKLKEYEAINLLQEEASKKNIKIDTSGLEFLYTMHQKDLGLCISELDKLSILNEPITSKTIGLQCFGLGNIDFEEFLEKLFTRQNINVDLYNILEEGIHEIQLVTKITQFAQMLFMVNSYLKLHGELNIINIWGYNLPKPIAQKYASIATTFKHEDFHYMMNYLLNLELELKNGKLTDLNAYTQAKIRTFLK